MTTASGQGLKLKPKMVQDTKVDFRKVKDLGLSQASLGRLMGLVEGKYTMTGTDWRLANSLVPKGLAETRRRVMDDVIQHKALREALLERELLRSPRMWYP